MALKLKELCRRVRLADGNVTYHIVGKDGRTLVKISEHSYREYELLAVRSDTMYSQNDKLFTRNYKTVYFN